MTLRDLADIAGMVSECMQSIAILVLLFLVWRLIKDGDKK